MRDSDKLYGSLCHNKFIDDYDFPMTIGEAYCIGEMEEVPKELLDL